MYNAFLPIGNTSLIKGTTTASAAQQPIVSGPSGCSVFSDSTSMMLIAFGVSTATATLPTTSTPAIGMPFQGNVLHKFQTPPGFWVSVIASTAGGTANVYVTPGIGI